MSLLTDNSPLGENLPRRGSKITRKLIFWAMRLFGWKISGEIPNLKKFIIIGAPHTSNWDFVIVIATASTVGIRISWMGKHTLFRKPLGPIFHWMGGVAVNRRAVGGIVSDTARTFDQADQLILCITPEGTRDKVTVWKSGFYHIAQEANVPILLAAFDYGEKVVTLGPLLQPSGDYETDLENIKAHYKGVKAKHPQSA